jgi:hypothetical protein
MYGCKTVGEAAQKKLVAKLRVLTDASNGDWIKVVKYKIAAFFSEHTGQKVPPCPFLVEDRPGFLFGGGASRWVYNFVKSSRKDKRVLTRLRSFLETILQSKGGMERPSKEYVAKKVSESVRDLTTERPDEAPISLMKWGDIDGLPVGIDTSVNKFTMVEQLKRTVREIFGESKYTLKDRLKEFFPSTSANYINNRQNAGAVGAIFDDEDLLKGLRSPGGVVDIDELVGNDEELQVDDELYTYNSSELSSRFSKLWFRILKKARSEAKIVKAVGLPEALKVRTITKGPPFTYTALRPLWKKLHSVMKKMKTFTFIGTPNTELGMLNILGRDLGSEQVYLSGDYAGATNNLFPWVSEAIADEISSILELTSTEASLFKLALTGHVFDVDGELKDQKMGQLMGSIMSFPVLCIANATMSRWAMEIGDRRVWTLNDAPLAINGDDVALRAHKSTYSIWSKITNFGGLIESIGKTFVSPEWVSINSMMYERSDPFPLTDVKEDGTEITRFASLKEVPHVNMGLAMGQKRSGGSFQAEDIAGGITFSSRARDLIDHCPKDMRSAIYKVYLMDNKESMSRTRLPWFIPEWLGGLGLPIVDPDEQVNSDLDLKIATKVLMNWNKKGQKPVSLNSTNTPWKIRRLCSSKVPPTVVTLKKDETVQALERVNGLLAVNLLFDSNFTLDDLYNDDGQLVNVKGAINHNARLWSPKGEIPSQCLPKEILYGPRRYEGCRVRDTAKGRNRFPELPDPPLPTKYLMQLYTGKIDLGLD